MSILAYQIGIRVVSCIFLVKCGIFLCSRTTASVHCSCSSISSASWENAAEGMQEGVGCLFQLGAHGPRLLYQRDDSAPQPSQHWRLHCLLGEKHKRWSSALTEYIKIITKKGHSDPGQRKGS